MKIPKIFRKKNEINPGTLIYTCNICGANCKQKAESLSREISSCSSCGSTVRMRGMMYALSIALFDKAIILPNFPFSPNLIGKGMSDWSGYSNILEKKLGYTNTYYHKEPKLDICNVSNELAYGLDFLITTDVLEHVVPPIGKAFNNCFSLLKDSGVLVMSVPYSLDENMIEHFPDLHKFEIKNRNGVKVLINETSDGRTQEFRDLIFHGGEGDTLEMRVFSELSLLKELMDAGFEDIQIMREPYFEYGIYWPQPWSLPLIARKKKRDLKIKNWGPRIISLSSSLTRQPNGDYGLWIELDGEANNFDSVVIMVENHKINEIVVADNLLTALIPKKLLKPNAELKISALNVKSGLSSHVGSTLVLE